MIEVVVNKDTKVLAPNKEHKNFTSTEEIIPEGTYLYGTEKRIQGLRRGEPFTYRLFFTDQEEVVYLNDVDKVEAMSNADSQVMPRSVDLSQDNTTFSLNDKKLVFLLAGGAIGYFVGRKYTKDKKDARNILVGSLAGFLIGKMLD
jgi:hypothetical protein